jgi:hypothetical protein
MGLFFWLAESLTLRKNHAVTANETIISTKIIWNAVYNQDAYMGLGVAITLFSIFVKSR